MWRAPLVADDEAALAAQQLALEAAALALHEEQQPKYWTDYLQASTSGWTMGEWSVVVAADCILFVVMFCGAKRLLLKAIQDVADSSSSRNGKLVVNYLSACN